MITPRQYITNTAPKLDATLSQRERWRLCGAIEAALTLAGIISPGAKFEYQPVNRGAIPMWLQGLPNHETYPEHIKRLATEYLKSTEGQA